MNTPNFSAEQSNRLLQAISDAQSRYIAHTEPSDLFGSLLENLLNLTGSEYGFIGEVILKEDGTPFLRTQAITNIAWNPETQKFYEENVEQGLEFFNLETLFGRVMTSHDPVISNSPASDPRGAGIPIGHPALNAFLGIPVSKGRNLLGMVGIANRPGGYDEELVEFLQPFIATCATMIEGYRNRADRQATERTARFAKSSLDCAEDAVYWISVEGEFRDVNPGACKMLGFTKQELLSKRVFDIDGTMSPELWPVHWQQLRDEKQLQIESVHHRKDGSQIPVSVSVNFVEFDGVEYNCAFVRNITDRKTYEKELKESEERKSAILDTALDCIITIDGDGKIIEFNPAAEKTFGYSRESAINHPLAELIIPPSLRDQHHEGLNRFHATGEGPVFGQRLELPAIRSDGSEFPIEIAINPIHLGNRTIFTAYLRDITDRKQAEDALHEARDAAEAASRFKSDFLASMSHEIRTPMTAVVGYADLLSRPMQDPELHQEWSRLLRRNAEYLLSLVNDVLDLSKIEAGKVELNNEKANVAAIIEEIDSLFRPLATEKMLEFRSEFRNEIPEEIEIDRTRFKQVVVNLVSNAIKFTSDGHVTINVNFEKEPSSDRNGKLSIIVEDTGSGIDPQLMEKLFTPFTHGQTGGGENRGTGLGLTISRHFAHLMGGELNVKSEVGNGSCFTFELDIHSDFPLKMTSPRSIAEREAASRNRSIPSLDGAVVLVVDDNVHNRTIVRFLIQDTGASVIEAEDGQAAIHCVNTAGTSGKTVDLILMDMQMPIMHGYAAAAKLREDGSNIPIVALTAYAMAGDAQKCLEAGCNAYMSKPIDPAELYSTMDRLIGRKDSHELIDNGQAPTTASSLAEDERFAPILKQYVAKLPGVIKQIESARSAENPTALRVLVHQLKGTAASYGFPKVSQIADRCQTLLLQGNAIPEIADSIDSLLELLREASESN